jgi:hypothetical protein
MNRKTLTRRILSNRARGLSQIADAHAGYNPAGLLWIRATRSFTVNCGGKNRNKN